MKLIMESWREFLKEEEEGKTPKVIFMSGAPGVGKGYVRQELGLDTDPTFQHEEKDEETGEIKVVSHVVDPDQFYVPMLKQQLPPLGVPEGEAANVEQLMTQYNEARKKLKELLGTTLNLNEPDVSWSSDVLEEMYEQAHNDSQSDPVLERELETTKQEYDDARNICVVQGKCFSAGQKEAKNLQQQLFEQNMSMIIDGTAGYYARIINQKEVFERAGYDVAMIFVDAPLETALGAQKERERKLNPFDVEKSMKTLLGGTYFDRRAGEEVSKPNIMKPFVDRFGRKQPGYEQEFGDNYFYVINDRTNTDESIAQMKPQLDRFLNQMSESFQSELKPRLHKQMRRLLRHGGNKDSGPFDDEAPIDYRGSAPPGAPGG